MNGGGKGGGASLGGATSAGGGASSDSGISGCVAIPPSVNVDSKQWKFATSPDWNCDAAGTTTIDSSAGTVTSTSCAIGTPDVTADAAQTDASGTHVMVVRLAGLSITKNHVLSLVGDKPIILLVAGDVLVDTGGKIDASAVGIKPGPGGSIASLCAGQTGGDGRQWRRGRRWVWNCGRRCRGGEQQLERDIWRRRRGERRYGSLPAPRRVLGRQGRR
jgi:hypothetical protein